MGPTKKKVTSPIVLLKPCASTAAVRNRQRSALKWSASRKMTTSPITPARCAPIRTERRRHRHQAESQRALPKHIGNPSWDVAAVHRLLTYSSQRPRKGDQDQEHAEASLEPLELTEVLPLTGQILRIGFVMPI